MGTVSARPPLHLTAHGLERWCQRTGQEPHAVHLAWQEAVFRGTARIRVYHGRQTVLAYGYQTGDWVLVVGYQAGRHHPGYHKERPTGYRLLSVWSPQWWAIRVNRMGRR